MVTSKVGFLVAYQYLKSRRALGEHVPLLMRGVEAWNAWRIENPNTSPNLGGASLVRADLQGAILVGASLIAADLSEANLSKAELITANLSDANLHKANLRGATLAELDLSGADLSGADLSEAILGRNVFASTNLTDVRGLVTCTHFEPSTIDHRTLQKSGPLPLAFLRGVGLPEALIEVLNQAPEFHSCFISYSAKDREFAEQLHADLQNKGVRCWFAPHDMPIGGKILDTIDEAIRLRDKVLLIFSEGALASDWVEGEVTRALDEERTRKETVLFPVRIDDAVLQTSEAWARLLRGQRNIGDFTRWKDHDSYQKSFERVLRDLKVAQAPAT